MTANQIKTIFDFGANNGDDVPYYLKKADVVVAVEANPQLCLALGQRFAAEIQTGRVRVENCVLTAGDTSGEVTFYLHRRNHVLGQFPRPDESVIHNYEAVRLPAKPVRRVIEEHGEPYYIKIDLENHDEVILRELFRNDIRPPYISAESQSAGVFALLAGYGGYKAFKLLDGKTISKKYRNWTIAVAGGTERYSFPPHSAGPFGDDIAGEWMSADDLFEVLAREKMGWKDIHATSLVEPAPRTRKRFAYPLRRLLRSRS